MPPLLTSYSYKPNHMAELTNSNSISGRRTSLKQIPKVDLTAMVDLAFLLITFFMLTTSLSQPTEMQISMPVKGAAPVGVAADRTMTVCLGADNKILWYMGTPDDPKEINLTSAPAIRHVFLRKMRFVMKTTGKPLIVLLKPDKKSTFRNLVDVLDEMAIAKVPVHAIVDITFGDREMLAGKGAN